VTKNQQSTKQKVGLVCKRYGQYCGAGHYYLTLLLLDNIKATAKDSGIKGTLCSQPLKATIAPTRRE
jgi:hypothetical protein